MNRLHGPSVAGSRTGIPARRAKEPHTYGEDHRFRRGSPSGPRARHEHPGRCGQGDPRAARTQRRPREEVGRSHHHQRRRLDRQGDRARRAVREDRRRAGQGSRQEDRRRGRRRHHDGDRPGPGAGPRGPAQRGRGCQPDGPQARHREGRRGDRRPAARDGQGGRDHRGDRLHGLHLRCRRADRQGHRRGHGQGRQGGRDHGRGVQHLRPGARADRGHALRQGLHLRLLRDRPRAHGGRLRGRLHPDRQLEDLSGQGPAAGPREGHAVGQAAGHHRRGRRRRGAVHPRGEQDPWHLPLGGRQGSRASATAARPCCRTSRS